MLLPLNILVRHQPLLILFQSRHPLHPIPHAAYQYPLRVFFRLHTLRLPDLVWSPTSNVGTPSNDTQKQMQ
jgi:hypothetical protein